MAKLLYEILGLEDDATLEQIKSAYRKRAKECHPDHHGEEKQAEFVAVSKAYAVLSDPEKKKRYDATGIEEEQQRQGVDETVIILLLQTYTECFKQDLHNHYVKYNKSVRRVLSGKKEMGESQHKELLRSYKRLVQIRKRIHRKGGENFVSRQITNDLMGIKSSLKIIRENLIIVNKALKLNDEFDYEAEVFTANSNTTPFFSVRNTSFTLNIRG